jgi:hypothetical protein
MNSIIALVYILSFAIQQFIQLFDILIDKFIEYIQKEYLPVIPNANIKKNFVLILSFLLGLLLSFIFNIKLLTFLKPDGTTGFNLLKCDLLELIISALVIGSGTEAVNILLKYFGYVKDARKENLIEPKQILILPPSKKLTKDTTFKFLCLYKNGAIVLEKVLWEVLDKPEGGDIDSLGKYKAPNKPNKEITILAKLESDPSVYSTASIEIY